MSLKHGLLGLLSYGAMTGYELDAAFKSSLSFFWRAKSSQIYRELDTMEKNGWLTSERVIQTDKPNKRVYSITGEGREELDGWLQTPQQDIDAAMSMRSAFLMRVFFAGETDDASAIALLKEFAKKCAETAEALSAVPASISQYGGLIGDAERRSKYWALTAMYGEHYYKAEIEWAQKAIAILEGGADEHTCD